MIRNGVCIKGFRKSTYAMEPLMATIIIVAIVIAVSMAVAYWMGGIAGLYTRFEELDIMEAYVTKEYLDSTEYYVIHLAVRNRGTAAATIEIDNILINDVPLKRVIKSDASTQYWYDDVPPSGSSPVPSPNPETENPQEGTALDATTVPVSITIGPGEVYYILIAIPYGADIGGTGTITAGLRIEIKLHTASGREFMKLLVLP